MFYYCLTASCITINKFHVNRYPYVLCIHLQVSHILFACAKVGYVPSAADELLQLSGRVYHKLIAQQNYRHALKLLYSLTTLQLFLDSELSKLFTLEMLEALDQYMAGAGNTHFLIINSFIILLIELPFSINIFKRYSYIF